MNFYLDFEATQYKNRILSIGCVADTGNTFYSLVNPEEKKLTNFIINLTGITTEEMRAAPSADKAFLKLKQFIRDNSNNEETFFFVYGNADKHFLQRTMLIMRDASTITFVENLSESLIDYSNITVQYFHTEAVSLKRALSYFRGESVQQDHDALDDSMMLKEVVENITNAKQLDHCPWDNGFEACLMEDPETNEGVPAPEDYVMPHGQFICSTISGKCRLFKTCEEASEWVINVCISEHDRIMTHKNNVMDKIANAATVKKRYMGYNWERID